MQDLDFDKTFSITFPVRRRRKYGKDTLVIVCVLKGLKKNIIKCSYQFSSKVGGYPGWGGSCRTNTGCGKNRNLIRRHRNKSKVKRLFKGKKKKKKLRRASTATCQQHHIFSSAPVLELGLQLSGPGQTSGCPSGPSAVLAWFAISHSRHFRDFFFLVFVLFNFIPLSLPQRSFLQQQYNIEKYSVISLSRVSCLHDLKLFSPVNISECFCVASQGVRKRKILCSSFQFLSYLLNSESISEAE